MIDWIRKVCFFSPIQPRNFSADELFVHVVRGRRFALRFTASFLTRTLKWKPYRMGKEHEMAEGQDVPRAEKPGVEGQPAESTRGFTSAPTADELKPTDREVFLLNTLLQWQETSAKSRIVLGQPLNA